MAYQKSKHVEAAQRFLHQGKVAQAVAEYQVVLKHEPKDQVTLMTVGDLFVRQGETFQALEYFERLAQIYLADGFLTKAIAIYKKIAKLAPEETRPVERLADLYVQQGVMSEARSIYLQLADMHQRAHRPAQAISLLRKLLDAEPDNLRVQTRLAELSLSTGQTAEAVTALRTAAQHLHRRGDHAEAIKYADRALTIDAKDSGALALRAQALSASGQREEAVAMLEKVPGVEATGEASDLLVDLYLEAGQTERACDLARKIIARQPKQHGAAQRVVTALLGAEKVERALDLLQALREPLLQAGEHEGLAKLLSRAAELAPQRVEPREWLVEVYRHTSDSFRLPDALAELAQVCEASGQLDLAVDAYTQLLERRPEDDSVRRAQERLQARLGQARTEPPPPVPIEAASAEPSSEPAPPPPPADMGLDEETRLFVSQALTDVDLYSSYGLTQKAIDLLDVVLQRVPDYAPALERLLDACVGAGDDARTVELAIQLERIHIERGDKQAAERFTELRRRFERTAAQAPEVAATSVDTPSASRPFTAPAPISAPVPVSVPVATAAEFSIPMVDAKPVAEAAAAAESASAKGLLEAAVHEVDLSEEWAAITGLSSDGAMLADNHLIESTPAPGPAAEEEAEEELTAEYGLALSSPEAASVSDLRVEMAGDPLQSLSAELDTALPSLAEPPVAPTAPAAPVAKAAAPAETTGAARPSNGATAAANVTRNGGPLGDLFEEFRAEMDEPEDQEDPEVHYNLGVAYREMGLLEEAISEFQKVAIAHQNGSAFAYAMQCYTLLALAFMEKSQPLIAATWYERALQIPGLDPDTLLALRYDLGVAQENAGETEAARKSFSQVYGMNIDYRDVAERLAALGRTR
jgi:tetratricopeptide (TPR) repeat protein